MLVATEKVPLGYSTSRYAPLGHCAEGAHKRSDETRPSTICPFDDEFETVETLTKYPCGQGCGVIVVAGHSCPAGLQQGSEYGSTQRGT
eukprot:4062109-Prymnesium_polylepis.1